jgi:hypothetical protein
MGDFNLHSMGPFDLFKHKQFLLSHNNTLISIKDDIMVADFKYTANSSILPSPGFRIPINVTPNVPLTLEISGNLLVGDKAFIYCECRTKPKNDQNTRIIPRTHLFLPGQKETPKIQFISQFNKIYLGILFFHNNKDYHFVLDKFFVKENKENNENENKENKENENKENENKENKKNENGKNENGKSKENEKDENEKDENGKNKENGKDEHGKNMNGNKENGKNMDGNNDIQDSSKVDRNWVDFGLVVGVLNRVRVVRDQNFHCAVIVEPRLDPLLTKIIDHFLTVLPTRLWNIVVYCGNLNVVMLREVYSNNNRVKLIHLPINNLTRESYSRLLLYSEFYMSIPAEHFLVFQMDTCLNFKSVGFLEKLLNYDYVGAPWKKKIKSLTEPTTINRVGNGGLSLRKKSSMIRVCQMIERTPKYQYLWKHHEDQVISSVLHSRLISGVIRMPDPDIAKKFAVESIFYPDPVGIHQAWRWLSPADYIKLRERIPVIDQLFKGIR